MPTAEAQSNQTLPLGEDQLAKVSARGVHVLADTAPRYQHRHVKVADTGHSGERACIASESPDEDRLLALPNALPHQ